MISSNCIGHENILPMKWFPVVSTKKHKSCAWKFARQKHPKKEEISFTYIVVDGNSMHKFKDVEGLNQKNIPDIKEQLKIFMCFITGISAHVSSYNICLTYSYNIKSHYACCERSFLTVCLQKNGLWYHYLRRGGGRRKEKKMSFLECQGNTPSKVSCSLRPLI